MFFDPFSDTSYLFDREAQLRRQEEQQYLEQLQRQQRARQMRAAQLEQQRRRALAQQQRQRAQQDPFSALFGLGANRCSDDDDGDYEEDYGAHSTEHCPCHDCQRDRLRAQEYAREQERQQRLLRAQELARARAQQEVQQRQEERHQNYLRRQLHQQQLLQEQRRREQERLQEEQAQLQEERKAKLQLLTDGIVKLQAVARGFMVRRRNRGAVLALARISAAVNDGLIATWEAALADGKTRNVWEESHRKAFRVINETVTQALVKCDGIESYNDDVRSWRKAVVRRLVAIGERVETQNQEAKRVVMQVTTGNTAVDPAVVGAVDSVEESTSDVMVDNDAAVVATSDVDVQMVDVEDNSVGGNNDHVHPDDNPDDNPDDSESESDSDDDLADWQVVPPATPATPASAGSIEAVVGDAAATLSGADELKENTMDEVDDCKWPSSDHDNSDSTMDTIPASTTIEMISSDTERDWAMFKGSNNAKASQRRSKKQRRRDHKLLNANVPTGAGGARRPCRKNKGNKGKGKGKGKALLL